jgi:hypothetical protein
MNNQPLKPNVTHILVGIIAALIVPLLVGMPIAHFQGIQPINFLKAIKSLSQAYNTAFQVGVVADVGIFFLLMKQDKHIFWARGWMIGTMIMATIALVRIAEGF